MLEKFNGSNIFLKNASREITYSEFKTLILNNLEKVKNKKENVFISGEEILPFVVNFFTAVYAKKNIFLVDEVIKLKNINFEYDVLSDVDLNFSSNDGILPSVKEEEIFVSLLTSGSSGIPKIIRNTLFNLILEAQGIIDSTGLEKKTYTVVTTTTPTHRYGLTYIVLIPILMNYIILCDKLSYPDSLKENNSLLVTTPSFLDFVKNSGIDFACPPETIFSAGSKLKQETYEYFEKKHKVIDIYGATETGVSAYRLNSKEKELTLLNDVKMEECDDGTIVYTPYSIEKGVKISDLIEVHQNKITLKARSDRLLKVQDKRISAVGLEDELRKNKFVSEAYCFKLDEKIACLCALTDKGREFLLSNGINELKKSLKGALREHFEIVPQRWKFIDKLPVTKRGKTDSEFISHLFSINFSFPIILKREQKDDSAKFLLWFYPSSNFYKGHFPVYPVTPGVVQLYLASFFGSRMFGVELSDGQMKRVKFSNIIKAGEIVELELIKNGENVSYEYRKDEITYSSGVLSAENILVRG